MTKTATLLASLVGPCPGCGNGRLETVFDGALTNLLCKECRACWRWRWCTGWIPSAVPDACREAGAQA